MDQLTFGMLKSYFSSVILTYHSFPLFLTLLWEHNSNALVCFVVEVSLSFMI